MSYNDDEFRKPRPCQTQIERMRKSSQLSNDYITRFIISSKEKNADPLLIAALEKQAEDAKLLVIEQGKRNKLEEQIAILSASSTFSALTRRQTKVRRSTKEEMEKEKNENG